MVPTENPFKDAVNRRRVLQGLGAIGAASIAGCLGDDGDGGGVDPVQDRVTVDPDDIEEGGTFVAGISEGPDTFDAAYSSSAPASILQNLLWESMIATDASGELYPWLAEDYETEDVQDVDLTDYEDYMITVEAGEEGAIPVDAQIVITHPEDVGAAEGEEVRVLTVEEAGDAVADGVYGMDMRFDLHEGITFNNGEEMTAENVVASYGRLEHSALAGQYFDSLLHVEADGDYTVHIYAQEPDAFAMRELAGWYVLPTEMTDLEPNAMDPRQGNTPIGSSPWELEEFQDEEYVIFTRTDDYWFDPDMKDWLDVPDGFPDGPVVDTIDISFVPDDASRSAALQNGEIDFTYGLTASTLNDYRAADEFRTAATQGAGYDFMQYPVRIPPWDDARVRRAVNHLIDRETISEDVFDGWESPAWVPLPPLAAAEGATDYDALVEDLREYNEYDPERAEELLEEAIEENDIETPIEVTVETNTDNDDRQRVNELIVESLNQTDYFEAELEGFEFGQFVTRILSEDYYERGALMFVGLSGGFSPDGYARAVHHPDNFAICCNVQNIDDQELNDLLREARFGIESVEDVDVRQERYDAVWERVLELNANSYTTHTMLVGVVNDEVVHGFNTYPSTQNIIGYAMWNPMDEQITYVTQD